MTEFRVWVDASASDPNASTEFLLVDANNGTSVADVIVSNAELPAKSWYTLTFSPRLDSSGTKYLLNIHSESEDGKGPRIAYSLQQEYPEGSLYENNDDINRDVIFQMGCAAGWKK